MDADSPAPRPVDKPVEIERKLARDLLPYFVSATEVSKHYKLRLYSADARSKDLLSGVAGLGIGAPVVDAFAAGKPIEFFAALGKVPLPLMVLAGGALAIWLMLKVAVYFTEAAKLGPSMQSYVDWMGALETRMHSVLRKKDPMPDLLDLQKDVEMTITRAHAEKAYPWTEGVAPRIDARVQAALRAIKVRNADEWSRT